MSNFQKNLKVLTDNYTQKYVADKTGFSQSSINNYLTKNSEPSIAFLVALKDAFGICVDDFLFSEITKTNDDTSYERFVGNYLVYYFNNDYYKGEVHTNANNVLSYGVISIVKKDEFARDVNVYGSFLKERKDAVNLLSECNNTDSSILECHKKQGNLYRGDVHINDKNIFIELGNSANGDRAFFIFNNPPSVAKYIGGVGTVNTISRGREHNPCIEYVIMATKLIDKPDGELYKYLELNDYKVNFDYAIADLISLTKRLYIDNNEISSTLTDGQKKSIIQNNLEYHFNEILQSNSFRFAKISNKEDDYVYKVIKEGIDVWRSKPTV